jgi:hypothetical protein
LSRDTLRGPGDIHPEEADVVVELISIGEREDAFEDFVEQAFHGLAGFAVDDFHEPVFEKRLAALVFGFEDAVGE